MLCVASFFFVSWIKRGIDDDGKSLQNATTTYTEVEPEGEEPLAGLAGVRQRGGRWRRITLVLFFEILLGGAIHLE